MGIKLGDISPLAGMATGKGMFGKISDKLGYKMGLLPGYLADKRKDKEEEKKGLSPSTTNTATDAQPGMKKGGMVKSSASKRADGIATKGKTKGRMV